MSFPPPPAENIDWAKLDLTIRDIVNGHVESRYNVKTGEWTTPEFVKDPLLRVHGLSPAFNYGQQAYEGLKAHRSPEDNILLFRPDKHATRMKHSTSVVSIPSIPETHFNACVSLAVSLNASFVPPSSSGGCLYIRPVVFGSSAHLGLTPPSEYLFCVYVQPFSTYHGVAPLDCLILEEFDRAAPFGTGNAKVGGNYAPVIRWTDQARKDGFPITLHLDSKTRSEVDEFSTSGFIGIHQNQDGKVTMVVPDSHNVIASVTSESCVELARSFGWTVEVRPIKYDELSTFTEVMAAGTAAALVPIRSITCRSRKDKIVYLESETPTPFYQQLYDNLKGIQQGKVKDTFGWCEIVGPSVNYVVDETVVNDYGSEVKKHDAEINDKVNGHGNGIIHEDKVNGHTKRHANGGLNNEKLNGTKNANGAVVDDFDMSMRMEMVEVVMAKCMDMVKLILAK